ncbi:hypothetical protein PMAYCL1PPCAC_14143, partial [Pristionchus mayeri]
CSHTTLLSLPVLFILPPSRPFQNTVKMLVLAQNSSTFYIPNEFADNRIDKNYNFSGSFKVVRKFDAADGTRSVLIVKFQNPFESISRAKWVYREIHFLRTLNHEHIVKLCRTYKVDEDKTDSPSIYYIIDYCGVQLHEKIEEGRYSMELVKTWTTELLRAIVYLHSKGIIHGNLHPGNICIDAANKLTISGFGNAHESIVDSSNNENAEAESISIYMPIEQLISWSGEYDEKVDVWSVATILCELILGQQLFHGETSGEILKSQIQQCGKIDTGFLKKITSETKREFIVQFSRKHERMDFIDFLKGKLKPERGISDRGMLESEDYLRTFIDRTLQFNPENRMSAQTALSHPFLQLLHPWEQPLPKDEKEALIELEKHIRKEIASAPMKTEFIQANH